MELQCMKQPVLDPGLMICPYCQEEERIGVHSIRERRYRCHACEGTFSETKGTIFYGLHYPIWLVTVVMTLLSYGCPPAAAVAAFFLDARTVAAWHRKAGRHGKGVQETQVCQGQIELGQVQADELCVTTQRGKVWMATAMSVFSRLFLWGEVSVHRNRPLIERVMQKVRQAAGSLPQAVLLAVDGFSAYPKAILKIFYPPQHTGQRGRPRHLPWPDLHIVQMVKTRSGRKLKEITRRLVHGASDRVYEMIASSQGDLGWINTAYIERLNATFRARMSSLVRRTRSLAQTIQHLEYELFWSGVVYNFCTVHDTLDGTPAMAAGLTDHVWSIQELLFLKLPQKPLHGVL